MQLQLQRFGRNSQENWVRRMLGPEHMRAMLCFQTRAWNIVRCCTLELREEQLFPFQ